MDVLISSRAFHKNPHDFSCGACDSGRLDFAVTDSEVIPT